MADYDTDNLTITTYTYDFAGNKTECSQTIKLDTTNPTADLTVMLVLTRMAGLIPVQHLV